MAPWGVLPATLVGASAWPLGAASLSVVFAASLLVMGVAAGMLAERARWGAPAAVTLLLVLSAPAVGMAWRQPAPPPVDATAWLLRVLLRWTPLGAAPGAWMGPGADSAGVAIAWLIGPVVASLLLYLACRRAWLRKEPR